MVRMLSLTENLHTILRVLYDDMMALCYPISQVAMAIAGIGALLYIAYRVWQSLAQAEPIDLFPLMRPFAVGICILFFPMLVLGSLNGILSPLVKATHSLMVGQTLDMEQWQERRERLELESREQMPPESYYAEDGERERELNELGLDDQTQQTLDRMNEGGMQISIGRLRPDTQYDYKFVCLSHNTLRGAAGGAVELAELLAAEGYITKK